MPGYGSAEFRFVPAGKIYSPTEIEKLHNAEIIHVDTGAGIFDHHETNDQGICASSLVLDYLIQNAHIEGQHETSLRRIINIITEIDHFREVFWPEPDHDRYEFFLEQIFDGFKTLHRDQDLRLMNFGFEALEAIYHKMQNKVKAEEEIKKGLKFTAGKNISGYAGETINDEIVKLAQKKGFQIVIRKDPRKNYVRIKAVPNGKIDLTAAYSALQNADRQATWFLHASRCMILNGSTKNPDMKPTKLSLQEVVEIIKRSL